MLRDDLRVRVCVCNQQDGKGFTPLMIASREGKISCVEALLRHGANDGLTNHQGQTARTLAELSNNEAILSIIDTFQTFAPKA